MSTKIKALFLATFLVISIGLKAQESTGGYEFTIVRGYIGATTGTTKIVIIKSSDAEYVDVPKGKEVGTFLIQKVEELNKQGWVVYNVTPNSSQYGTSGFDYHLKRKIK